MTSLSICVVGIIGLMSALYFQQKQNSLYLRLNRKLLSNQEYDSFIKAGFLLVSRILVYLSFANS